ncbi:hypothetical protein C8B47_06180 [filamentous cyanobacterium CCP4]|nr:hypothetical protein C8B47_06180 [filamentous cyanobacterium CCP4]
MGTFSYQHGAKTPEEADQKQLARLQNQGDQLRQRALQHGLNLTLEETLNGLDLANQSPLAAIGRVGYIERLAEAKANGLEGSEAILVARTRSYINPNTGRWNAPGLGNTEASIRRDQQRRANAVAQAIAAYESQNPKLQANTWTLTPSPAPVPDTLVAVADTQTEPVDEFLQMWTSPSDPVAQVEPAADTALLSQANEADAQAENEAGLTTSGIAMGDRVLATLWQFTVDKVPSLSSDASDAKSEAEPQAASLADVLLNRSNSETEVEGTVPEAEVIPAEPVEVPAAAAPAPETEPPAAAAPIDPAPSLVSEVQAETNPTKLTHPDQSLTIAPPTWSEAREGNQSSPALATPGAFPDSIVYVPLAPAEPSAAATPAEVASAEATIPADAETTAIAEPLAPATAGEPISPAELAAPEMPAPDQQASITDGGLQFAKVDAAEADPGEGDAADRPSIEASLSSDSQPNSAESLAETSTTVAEDQALVAVPEAAELGQTP